MDTLPNDTNHAPRDRATQQVLIVEDDANINEVLCTLLRDERYTTRSATTLDAARTQLQAETPACVLLDFNLPDGRSDDLLGEMTSRGHGTPCVMMSASNEARDVAQRFGIPFVKKPFDFGTLLQAIGAAIDLALGPREGRLQLA